MGLRYVWEKWNKVSKTKYTYEIKESTRNFSYSESYGTLTVYSSISINTSTGEISGRGADTITYDTSKRKTGYCYFSENPGPYGDPAGWYFGEFEGKYLNRYEVRISISAICEIKQNATTVYQKGSTSYGNVSSASSGAYPANNYSGSYWYVSKGSDTIDPAAVSYDTSTVIAGKTVTATISPSSGIVNGGTITYSVEINTDETGWEPYIEITATTFTFDIPKDAVSWRVRVKARDNMGFSSSTYVYGNNAVNEPTTVIHPSVFAVIPEDKNLGFVSTSSIVSYLVTTDDNVDYTISVSLNGTTIYSATESPKARTLTIPDENWEALSLEQVHTVVMLISQGDK